MLQIIENRDLMAHCGGGDIQSSRDEYVGRYSTIAQCLRLQRHILRKVSDLQFGVGDDALMARLQRVADALDQI